jgi:enamine deaminase RidA (YjgF/YER057c/UK114 family)
MNKALKSLEELDIAQPHPAARIANYVGFIRIGAMQFSSRKLPVGPDSKISPAHAGKLGPDIAIEVASDAARVYAINLIAEAQSAGGDLDGILYVARLRGFFNVTSGFDASSQARNGAFDLMAPVFGECRRHARTAVGAAHLPLNALVEIEATFEVE